MSMATTAATLYQAGVRIGQQVVDTVRQRMPVSRYTQLEIALIVTDALAVAASCTFANTRVGAITTLATGIIGVLSVWRYHQYRCRVEGRAARNSRLLLLFTAVRGWRLGGGATDNLLNALERLIRTCAILIQEEGGVESPFKIAALPVLNATQALVTSFQTLTTQEPSQEVNDEAQRDSRWMTATTSWLTVADRYLGGQPTETTGNATQEAFIADIRLSREDIAAWVASTNDPQS